MSETTEQPGGAAAPAEEYRPTDVLSSEGEGGQPGEGEQPNPGEPAPVPGEGEQPKPAEELAPDPAEEKEKAAREKAAIEARFAQLSRRGTEERQAREAAEQRAAELAARLRRYEAAPETGGQSVEEQIRQGIERGIAEQQQQQQLRAWDAAGRKAFPDWQQRCSDLVELGASSIAPILVEMGPEGATLTGELANDPAELARILALPSERARALALGQFSAAITARRSAAPPARQVSQMPAPIRPPQNAKAMPEPNPEADYDSYLKWSSKQKWSR